MSEVTMMPSESSNIVKIKVKSAKIVVHGTIEKPYYEIEYYGIDKEESNIGYSSYDLNNVFKWLKEYFEIVGEDVIGDLYNNLISKDNKPVYAIKNSNAEYFIGYGKWDKQLRKAKLYHAINWAEDVMNDSRFDGLDLKIVKVVIYEEE